MNLNLDCPFCFELSRENNLGNYLKSAIKHGK